MATASATGTATATAGRSLGFGALTALTVGSMIGGGIFSLPQNMAAHAGAGAILIAWLLTGAGMLMLALVFRNLARCRPTVTGGVYGYARAGFGDLVGFCSAWGYWLSSVIANVSFLVLLFSALGAFPALSFFGDGTRPAAVAAGSVLLWALHVTVLRGVRAASTLNTVSTVAKIVPIVLFIVCVASVFDPGRFLQDFWGGPGLGGVPGQVRQSMLVTVWVFIGIEGAAMLSARARNPVLVGRATVAGFLLTMALLAAVSLLALGVLPQPALAALHNPSAAGVMTRAVGAWGGRLINLGLVVSVGGALLAWTLIAAEVPRMAGCDRVFPAAFARVNRNGAPALSLWLTNGAVQLVLLLTGVSAAGYLSLLLLATSLVLLPYLLCGGYAVSVALQGDSRRELVTAVLATVYGIWLLVAAGPGYLLVSAILYAPGLALFALARRQQGRRCFDRVESLLAAGIVALALAALYALGHGLLRLG